MRVVITGASGNVGTSVVETLERASEVDEIVCLARRVPSSTSPKASWASADITSSDLVSHFRGADVVVHLAWLFQPTHDPVVTWRNNVLGSLRVFEATAQAGVGALVHASSIGAYSPRTGDQPVDESWPTHALPVAAYGREKSYLERVLDTFERDHPDIRVVRMRPGFIFKRASASEQRRLFAGPFLPNRLVRPGLVPFLPDLPGLQLQALHTADAAEAYRLVVTSPARGPFNVAADPVLDVRTLGELFGARPVKMPTGPVRAMVAAAWRLHLAPASPGLFDLALSLPVMDTSRIRTELGWTPSHTATDALAEVLKGMREGAGGPAPTLTERGCAGAARFRALGAGR